MEEEKRDQIEEVETVDSLENMEQQKMPTETLQGAIQSVLTPILVLAPLKIHNLATD